MRTFVLRRTEDVSGVSGTGIVAEGVEFTDGSAVVHWIVGDYHSTVVWPSLEAVIAVHGHGGATKVEFSDPRSAPIESTMAYSVHIERMNSVQVTNLIDSIRDAEGRRQPIQVRAEFVDRNPGSM